MYKRGISFFLIFCIALSSYARNKKNPNKFYGEIPFDKSKLDQPRIVRKRRFELNIKPDETYEILEKMRKQKQMLDGVYGINIKQSPLIKPLKTITTIYLHPNFISTIIFPKKYKINSKPQVSFPLKVFEYDSNTIRIRPSTDATEGNIVLSLTDGIQNYSITIFYKKYIPNLKCTQYSINDCRNTELATVIKFIDGESYNPFDIIEEYKKLHHLKRLKISKNLGYVVLSKGKDTYYIIRDDEFGTIYKDGILLRVKKKL